MKSYEKSVEFHVTQFEVGLTGRAGSPVYLLQSMNLPLIVPPQCCQLDTAAFYHYFTSTVCPASITSPLPSPRLLVLVLIMALPCLSCLPSPIILIHPHLALPDSFRVLVSPPSNATQIARHGCLELSRQQYIQRLTGLTCLLHTHNYTSPNVRWALGCTGLLLIITFCTFLLRYFAFDIHALFYSLFLSSLRTYRTTLPRFNPASTFQPSRICLQTSTNLALPSLTTGSFASPLQQVHVSVGTLHQGLCFF